MYFKYNFIWYATQKKIQQYLSTIKPAAARARFRSNLKIQVTFIDANSEFNALVCLTQSSFLYTYIHIYEHLPRCILQVLAKKKAFYWLKKKGWSCASVIWTCSKVAILTLCCFDKEVVYGESVVDIFWRSYNLIKKIKMERYRHVFMKYDGIPIWEIISFKILFKFIRKRKKNRFSISSIIVLGDGFSLLLATLQKIYFSNWDFGK